MRAPRGVGVVARGIRHATQLLEARDARSSRFGGVGLPSLSGDGQTAGTRLLHDDRNQGGMKARGNRDHTGARFVLASNGRSRLAKRRHFNRVRPGTAGPVEQRSAATIRDRSVRHRVSAAECRTDRCEGRGRS